MLLVACLLYPLTATPARRDRFENSTSRTIDGTAFMQTSVYYDDGRPVTLNWDRQAFEWLKQNVHGIPTILEANTPLYRWGSRVSIYTGLPTVIGWDWHQKQQRCCPAHQICGRAQGRCQIHHTPLLILTGQWNYYNVTMSAISILVGWKHLYYAGDGLEKFKQDNEHWSVVYQNEEVTILQVH